MAIEIPGYKIRKTIGKGGMASVYLAEQEIFERDVALKVMSRALAEDPSFGQRFFREAKIVSQLVHPNIVTVYDVGVHKNTYYLSMEYVDGGDLKSLRRKLSLTQKVRAVRDIAKALDYAGAKGYVHRDIKPENIMFHTGDGRAVLMDFGIARAAELDSAMTQTGIAIGTPHYMSPEQAKGQAVDPRSDIYSLGVVLFLLITGAVPYNAESAVAIGIKHITEPVPRLPEPYTALQPLIDRSMAKKPEDRFQTAKEFFTALMRTNMSHVEQKVRQFRESGGVDPVGRTRSGGGVSPYSRPGKASNDITGFVQAEPNAETLKPALVPFEDEQFDSKRGIWTWLLVGGVALAGSGLLLREFKPELVQSIVTQAGHTVASTASAVEQQLGLNQPPIDLPGVEQMPATPAPLPQPTTEVVFNKVSPEPQIVQNTPIPRPSLAPAASEYDISVEPTLSIVDDVKPALQEPVQEEGESPAILALRSRTEELRSVYLGEIEKLPELVDAYRALLANVPDDGKAGSELELLKIEEIERIRAHSGIGELDQANDRLLQLRYLFPEITETQEYAKLESWVANHEKIYALLADAEELLNNNALTLPKDDSALDRYQQILEIDPDHKAAKSGMRNISEKLVQMASKRLKSRNEDAARVLLQKAIDIDDKNTEGQTLLKSIERQAQVHRNRENMLKKAGQRLGSGDLFEPETNSAFYFYSEVLKRFPDDPAASSGIDRVVEALSSRIFGLLGEQRFDQARAELIRPMRLMGETNRLQKLAAAIEEVNQGTRSMRQ
ncbi:MAG: protein kinase [Cellvibrionaceae bacterium]|nr:protein kinase [Cellvibrionaceae bacterium]